MLKRYEKEKKKKEKSNRFLDEHSDFGI